MTFDTHQTVIDYLEAVLPELSDYAFEYGEPGYSLETGATPLIVFGNYWCRCDKFGDDKLHTIDKHYPRTFARLEEQGVTFEWLDEWIVDHDNGGKAYRSSPDSYSWQPSFVYTEDGELLTPDDDLETWIEYMANDPRRCIPGTVYTGADLVTAGFTQHNGRFENGWHPGQDDDPKVIDAEIRRWADGDVDVVFALDSTGQFDIQFSAYWREVAS